MPNFEIYNELQDLELLRWTRTLMSNAHSTHLINAVLSFAMFNEFAQNIVICHGHWRAYEVFG